MKKLFSSVDFQCGVGIAYGELRIIKAGIQRNGTERGENKGLIWTGHPANIASRLTDNAAKTIKTDQYEVRVHPVNPFALRPRFQFEMPRFGKFPPYNPHARLYLDEIRTEILSATEFANRITQDMDGSLHYSGGKLVKFTKQTNSTAYPPILFTEEVYNGFKKANPTRKCILQNFWTEIKHNIKDVPGKVWGGDVHWIM